MSALVRKTYLISCDHVGDEIFKPTRCGVTRQIIVPDESLGAASEWVLKALRRLGWTYRPRNVGPPQHYCRQHKPSPVKRATKINNGGK